jgi:LAO/AO transport system kinase
MTPEELRSLWQKDKTRGLAVSITLAESSLWEHRLCVDTFLTKYFANPQDSIRIGISGPPGVGKSTFIEKFGQKIIAGGRRLAVLAIDPTSPLTGGSILGDKTRMQSLAVQESVYIRPSPSGSSFDGTSYGTRQAIRLCEAAGYDCVIIETVGAGQINNAVASMTDLFINLHQPNSGDELQGLKKGSLEVSDFIVITKADGDQLLAAERAKLEIEEALGTGSSMTQPKKVLLVSAIADRGIDLTWIEVSNEYERRMQDGSLSKNRLSQNKIWLNEEILFQIKSTLETAGWYHQLLDSKLNAVQESKISVLNAAHRVVEQIISTS